MSQKNRTFDIDIDVNSDTDKSLFGIRAMVYNKETQKVIPHPSGVHITPIPVDGMTGHSAIDHELADQLGYIKVDILTNTSYNIFNSKKEILQFSEKEPDWSLFRNENIVKKLPHIGNHFDVVSQVEPQSIEELADVLAIIRPGKRHLLESYLRDKNSVRRELYKRSANGKAYFKKSHAISYAVMIVTVLNRKQIFSLK